MQRFSVRVYYEDTDAGGIVYYANYLKFAERARTEALRAGGIEQSALLRDTGIALVVRRCAAEFLKPARLDDSLTIETRLADIHAASLELEQTILRGGETLVSLSVTVACIGQNARPARLPQPLKTALIQLFNL